jgi:hypothetical protein
MSARVDKCDKKSVIVSPSILSANFAKLGEQARERRARRLLIRLYLRAHANAVLHPAVCCRASVLQHRALRCAAAEGLVRSLS